MKKFLIMFLFSFIILINCTACSSREVVDTFSLNGDNVAVWLESGSMVYKDRKLIFVASEPMEIVLSGKGNYKILE